MYVPRRRRRRRSGRLCGRRLAVDVATSTMEFDSAVRETFDEPGVYTGAAPDRRTDRRFLSSRSLGNRRSPVLESRPDLLRSTRESIERPSRRHDRKYTGGRTRARSSSLRFARRARIIFVTHPSCLLVLLALPSPSLLRPRSAPLRIFHG